MLLTALDISFHASAVMLSTCCKASAWLVALDTITAAAGMTVWTSRKCWSTIMGVSVISAVAMLDELALT